MPAIQVIEIIAVNALAWFLIQMGFAWLGTRMPITVFDHGSAYFREHAFERSGRFYEGVLRIKDWKDLLPDGSRLFRGGFPKGRLAASDTAYLTTFVRETRRGEAVHLAVILSSAFFFLWNPPGIAAWMVVYAVVSNLPCILAQRYNRIRMARIVRRRENVGRVDPS